jgi:hypothetical protein
MTKFKIGDIVKIIHIKDIEDNEVLSPFKNNIMVIKKISNPNSEFKYLGKLLIGNHEGTDGCKFNSTIWCDDELELFNSINWQEVCK